MTREEFESKDFNEAMEELYDQSNVLTTYEMLKECIIQQIQNDNNMWALHLLEAIYNSEGNSNWYYYDYTAGTTCTPVCLNNVEDVESFIGFDEE